MNYRHAGRFSPMPHGMSAPSATGVPPILSHEERELLRVDATRVQSSRELRRKLFDKHIFGEYGWDILLALYVSESVRGRLNTTELCEHSGAAMTTALRWLDFLEERDLINRFDSPVDQRIVYVELSDKGRMAMDTYFLKIRDAAIFAPVANG
jgi:hypothetical protein